MKHYKTALTIAGSDCSGGAGIQADLKTFSALGCYGMSVITALTAQNTRGVQAIYKVPADFIGQQLKSIRQDIHIDALKIGMLQNADIIFQVLNYLKQANVQFIVIDPVMIAKNNATLLELSAVQALYTQLFPLATLITPNLNEAELILEKPILNQEAMEQAANLFCTFGAFACLIKGGHLPSEECADCLYISSENKYYWFTESRINTANTHGTGCTLSAAITAYLAKGYTLLESVRLAKKYITEAIIAGNRYRLGKGHGPVHHFAGIW